MCIPHQCSAITMCGSQPQGSSPVTGGGGTPNCHDMHMLAVQYNVATHHAMLRQQGPASMHCCNTSRYTYMCSPSTKTRTMQCECYHRCRSFQSPPPWLGAGCHSQVNHTGQSTPWQVNTTQRSWTCKLQPCRVQAYASWESRCPSSSTLGHCWHATLLPTSTEWGLQ
jgi:hypothetical protein